MRMRGAAKSDRIAVLCRMDGSLMNVAGAAVQWTNERRCALILKKMKILFHIQDQEQASNTVVLPLCRRDRVPANARRLLALGLAMMMMMMMGMARELTTTR